MAREEVSDQGPVLLDCIPSKKIAGIAADHFVSAILSEHHLSPLHHLPMERRRDVWGAATNILFPAVSGNPILNKANLQKAEELSSKGFGLAVITRHFSNNDFLMLTGFLRRNSHLTHDRESATPLAYHMYAQYAKSLLEYFGVEPLPLVTLETQHKGKNFDKKGNKLKLASGTAHFQTKTVDLLNNGGLLFIAPSATRTAKYEPWRLVKPIEMLTQGTGDNLAFMPVGLDLDDPDITDYEKFRGYNLFRRYTVNIGEPLTKQELIDRAQDREVKVDRFMADQIAILVKPQTLGEVYRELREQRLAQAA